MGLLDIAIVGGIIIAFIVLIGSRIYNHEKSHIDPIIKKIKGWFTKEDDDSFEDGGDYEVSFRGNVE